jgi:uncharacterized membrane protein YfcA
VIPAGELATLALLVPIAFLGSIVFGLTGFGSALVTIPLASHFLPLPLAIATFSVIDLANALRVGLERPGNAVRGEWLRLLPTILIGVAVGTTVLVNLPRQAGMGALGVFVFAYAVYALARRPALTRVSTRWAYPAGFAGGVTGTIFGAGGPPYAIYLSHRGLTKDQFRATLSLTTLFSISVRVAAFALSGLLADTRVWVAAAACVPASMLGIALASRLFRRLSREVLMRAIACVLLATGLSLMVRAMN